MLSGNSNYTADIFSNPFGNPGIQPSAADLTDVYHKLEALKAQQQIMNNPPAKSNVLADITREWENISDDEKYFIENSKEYQDASNFYQQEFSAFLIEHLGNDFVKSPHGVAAEKVLGVIRGKKELYKNKFANDISEIKEKNSQLERNNEELAKNNIALQEQLKEIQKRLGN
jgi:hypothetical protein